MLFQKPRRREQYLQLGPKSLLCLLVSASHNHSYLTWLRQGSAVFWIVILAFGVLASTSGILRTIKITDDVGRVSGRWDSRWFVDQSYNCALFVVMKNSWIKNIAIFDPRPKEDFSFIAPFFAQGINGDCCKPDLINAARTESYGDRAATNGKIRFGIFNHWEGFKFDPGSQSEGRGKTNILVGNTENIFTQYTVLNARRCSESFHKNESAQLSFGSLATMAESKIGDYPQSDRGYSQSSSQPSERQSVISKTFFGRTWRAYLSGALCGIALLLVILWELR